MFWAGALVSDPDDLSRTVSDVYSPPIRLLSAACFFPPCAPDSDYQPSFLLFVSQAIALSL